MLQISTGSPQPPSEMACACLGAVRGQCIGMIAALNFCRATWI